MSFLILASAQTSKLVEAQKIQKNLEWDIKQEVIQWIK